MRGALVFGMVLGLVCLAALCVSGVGLASGSPRLVRDGGLQIWVQNDGSYEAELEFEIAKVTYHVPAGWWICIDGDTGDGAVFQYREMEP